MSLDKVQLGLLGTVFFWVYGIGQLINGNIGDRVKTKRFIFIALIAAGMANILFGFAAGIAAMFAIWAVNAYFQSMLWGPIVKTLAVWFPHSKRASVSIGISTSMVVGYWLAWGGGRQCSGEQKLAVGFLDPGRCDNLVCRFMVCFFLQSPGRHGP